MRPLPAASMSAVFPYCRDRVSVNRVYMTEMIDLFSLVADRASNDMSMNMCIPGFHINMYILRGSCVIMMIGVHVSVCPH